ncbi:rRNA-processing protein FCF1 like protein [Astathelohania contejeani]|uniref:rRNA-processing protein FCF1 like protein n=1 Tax=Astathelohania contejeani TaxID=164912 RepID=A0ABQ7I1Z4_9MICR|nr:rRNA-processing protein FCF1 like protein [Thelohania contejeani]
MKRLPKIKKMLNLNNRNPPKEDKEELPPNEDPQFTEYFTINHSLIPPYNVIIDTNFINHSIRRKLDMNAEFIKCLYSRVNLFVTECVIGELERLGRIYRVALAIARDPKVKRLNCDHKGIYADDCIVNRVTTHRCYIVATCDTELKQRIRKIPGVPIIYVRGAGYEVERLPRAPLKK